MFSNILKGFSGKHGYMIIIIKGYLRYHNPISLSLYNKYEVSGYKRKIILV